MRNEQEQNRSDRRNILNIFKELPPKALALVGAGALLAASLSACGGEKADAEPTPEPTTTTQEATPTPSEVVTTPPAEVITEMPEIPTFRPDGQPWEGVDDTYDKIKASQDLIANAGDESEIAHKKITEASEITKAINQFVEQNTGLDLYGTDKNNMLDLLPIINDPNDPEIVQGVAERYVVTEHVMVGLYISSQPGSAGEKIVDAWAENTFTHPDDLDSWKGSADVKRNGIERKDPESTANTIDYFYGPQIVVGATGFREIGGPDQNYWVMDIAVLEKGEDDEVIDADFVNDYADFYEIGVGPYTAEVEFHDYLLFEDVPPTSEFVWTNDIFGKTVGEAKEMVVDQE